MTLNAQRQFCNPVPIRGLAKVPVEPFLQPDHPASRLLAYIRKFNANKGTVQNPNGLLSNNVPLLMKLFQEVATSVKKMFDSKEGKCVEVSSPCFIMGDIHGNIEVCYH